MAPLLAANMAPVPIGSRVVYTIKGGGRRLVGRNEDVTREMVVVALEPDRRVVLEDDDAIIRAAWPDEWADGTVKEVQ